MNLPFLRTRARGEPVAPAEAEMTLAELPSEAISGGLRDRQASTVAVETRPPVPDTPFDAGAEEETLRAVFAALAGEAAPQDLALKPQDNSQSVPSEPDDTVTVLTEAPEVTDPPIAVPPPEAAMPEAPAEETPAAEVASQPESVSTSAPGNADIELPDDASERVKAPPAVSLAAAEREPVPAELPPTLTVETQRVPEVVEPPAQRTAIPEDAELVARIAAADAAVEVAEVAPNKKTGPRPDRAQPFKRLVRSIMGRSSPPAARAYARCLYAPLPLILVGSWIGGPIAALSGLAVAIFSVLSIPLAKSARSELRGDVEFPLSGVAARYLPAVYAASLAFCLFSLAWAGWAGPFGWLCTVLSLGIWVGIGPIRLARSLARSRSARDRRIADAIFISMLMGHRAAAERMVIPRFAATSDDPHTPDPGEGFWVFTCRSIAGSFLAGHALVETLMRPRLGRKRAYVHPFLVHIAGSAVMVFVCGVAFGPIAVPSLLMLSVVTHLVVAMDDYTARYGLHRRKLPDGRIEPLGPRHRWSAPDPMVWIGRATSRASATQSEPGPVFPRPLPAMIALALVPRIWSGEMDVRVMAMLKSTKDPLRTAIVPSRAASAKFGTEAHARLARAAKL